MMNGPFLRRDPVTSPKRATNVSLPEALVAEAKELGISVSRSCEVGLAAAVKKAREEKWIDENRATFAYWNKWVEENGIPLAKYRQF